MMSYVAQYTMLCATTYDATIEACTTPLYTMPIYTTIYSTFITNDNNTNTYRTLYVCYICSYVYV